jgi:hypothetical protein
MITRKIPGDTFNAAVSYSWDHQVLLCSSAKRIVAAASASHQLAATHRHPRPTSVAPPVVPDRRLMTVMTPYGRCYGALLAAACVAGILLASVPQADAACTKLGPFTLKEEKARSCAPESARMDAVNGCLGMTGRCEHRAPMHMRTESPPSPAMDARKTVGRQGPRQ